LFVERVVRCRRQEQSQSWSGDEWEWNEKSNGKAGGGKKEEKKETIKRDEY